MKDILGLLILPIALLIIVIIYAGVQIKYFGTEIVRVLDVRHREHNKHNNK